MKSWYVYLVLCSDLTLYCGVTDDLSRRVEVHNAGKGAKYTRSRLPVQLVWYEPASSKSKALRREIWIKKLSRRQKQVLIHGVNNYIGP